VRRLASEGIIEATLLDRARPPRADDRLVRLVRRHQGGSAQLEARRERTPRGGTRWHPSSAGHLLTRTESFEQARTSDDPASNSSSRAESDC
jgi:hypothetical protein